MPQMKQYLGDAVYADFDGNHLILSVEDGISASHIIYLEAEVVTSLLEYIECLREDDRLL